MMSARNLAGLVVLCAAALLVATWLHWGEDPGGEPADERELAAYDAAGVRLSLPDLDDSDAGSSPRGLGFGPAPPLAASSDPLSRAVQALTDGQNDRAIGLLERALESDPDDSELNATLSTAYLARGLDAQGDSEGERAADLAEALDRIGRDPADLPSLFNRALALEALYCYRMAAGVWESYLERDPGSEWGALAAERLDRVREVVAELDQALAASRMKIGAAKGTSSRASSDRAPGVARLNEARRALDDFQLESALEGFRAARTSLEADGDSRAWYAEAGIAEAERSLLRFDHAEPRARRVLEAAKRSGDRELEARALWLLADLHLGRMSLQKALVYAQARHALGREIRDAGLTASAGLTLSRVLDELGDPESAWVHRFEALRTLAELRDPRLPVTIGNSSLALARQERFRAAEDFASEMLIVDRELDDPLGLTESLWLRASHRVRSGDVERALADLSEADSHLDRIEDAGLRARLDANLRAVEGAILQGLDPNRAIDVLSNALSRIPEGSQQYGRPEILLERARANRRLGRSAEAARDLDSALLLVADQRERIGQPILRVTFFDLQEELADEAVAVAVERGEVGEAFVLAERAKGVLLRESLGMLARPAPSREELFSSLGPDEVLVSYWSLPEELLIWTLRPGEEPVLHRRQIDRPIVEALAERWADAFERGEASPELEQLAHRVLIAPVAERLAGARRIVVVPDRSTRGVAWGALREDESGQRLLERFVVRVRPTALAVDLPEKRQAPTHRADSFLAVGDPRGGTGWTPLPAARREATSLAALFDRSTLLIGPDATESAMRAALPAASIVHIAAHFETGGRPWSTWIGLAPEPGGAAGLSVSEIAGLDLRHLRLVVLSGCASQREGEPSLEGTFAAAGAFLAAGAHEAIASLWPVDDKAAAELMAELYPRLLRGMEADEALREAQLTLMHREGDSARVADWAAFQLFSLRPPGGAVVP